MTSRLEVTSRRRWRLLVVLVALLALASTLAASTGRAAATVRPAQDLVVLLAPHDVRSAPSDLSDLIDFLPARTPITEQRTVLPVLAHHGLWLNVRLPGRPNGHTGWISRRKTTPAVTPWHLVVVPSRRTVIVYRAGRPVRTFPAVVGKLSTPTPPGTFYVEESIALRAADVGAPFALALSARSTVYQEFAGGPGQIGIHGIANIGGMPGTAVSHGCVRISTPSIRWLATHVGSGTPVTVTR